MIVLFSAGSPDIVLNALEQSFLSVQQPFSTKNLVLNTSKTKVMWFGKKNAPLPAGVITTSESLELEVVTLSNQTLSHAPYRTSVDLTVKCLLTSP